jgi:hypothetical protein
VRGGFFNPLTDGADLCHQKCRLLLFFLGQVHPVLAARLLALASLVPDLAAVVADALQGGLATLLLWLPVAFPPPLPFAGVEDPSPCFRSRTRAAHSSSVNNSWPPADVRAGASTTRSSTALSRPAMSSIV